MVIDTTINMLQRAREEKYAIGAFNVENMEMIQAVIEAAVEADSPIIVQTSTTTMHYADFEYYTNMLSVATKHTSVPVALNFDHCMKFEHAMQAVRAGYTSIMIDGSKKSFEDNVAITKQVVDACRPIHVPVEAELGFVGGKENDVEMGVEGYTDPSEAKQFVEETGVSSLAVAIGTQHGAYTAPPNLDIERLKTIKETVDVPLVLHGGSGLSVSQLKDCIENGISKINFAAELRSAFTAGVKQGIEENPDAIDPKVFSAYGRENVKNTVLEKLEICGSIGKASE